MSEPRDPDLVVKEWLREGPSRGPERGLAETLARIRATDQPRRLTAARRWLGAVAAAAAAVALVALGFTVRPFVPLPAAGNPTPTACWLEFPVSGRNALLVGHGFAPSTPVVLEIDRANGTHISISGDSSGLNTTAILTADLHTDPDGNFGINIRPYPDDLGRGHIEATAGCTAGIDVVVRQQDLPEPCPNPDAVQGATVSADAYRRSVETDRPIHWWRLDDTNATAVDVAGGADGSYEGAGVTHARLSALSSGGAVFLDGRDALVSVPSMNLRDFTLEAWVYMCQYEDDGDTLLGKRDAPQSLNFGGGALHLTTGVSDTIAASTPVSPGRWQHWVVTRAGDEVQLYLDGRLDASNSGWSDPLSLDTIGDGTSGPLLGLIDEVAIYDRALPADRVAAHVSGSP